MSKQEEEVEESAKTVDVEVLEAEESSVSEDNESGNEDLEALRAKAAKADENWERVLRLTAELDNYKKRSARDRDDAVRYASERFVGQLLPVLDSFTMAVAATEQTDAQDVKSLKVGINMILTQFQGILKDMGVEELDAAGKDFDPTWQEAMSQQETEDVAEGKVLQQLRKGYRLKERLIRPASVVVAKAPAQDDESDNSEAGPDEKEAQ